MGTDISICSGVIVDIDDMVGMLREQDVKITTKICCEFYENLEEGSKETFKVLGDLDDPTLEQLKKALTESHDVERVLAVSAGADDDGCYCEDLEELWRVIIGETRPDFCYLDEVRVFGSGRLNGWEVPLGELCFIFAVGDGDEAEEFENIMGHCHTSNWTVVSY